MYNKDDLKKLADEYKETKAPENLHANARNILYGRKQNNKITFLLKTAGLTAATLAVTFIAAANLSPSFAETLQGVPFLNSAARLVTFRAYEQTDEHHELAIDQPQVDGLENDRLTRTLNDKYAAKAAELYEEYTKKTDGGIENITLLSGYSIKSNNGTTVSIEHNLFTAEASGAQRYEYDTLDIENELYITLPSLFRDDSYTERISSNIRQQMEDRMAQDPSQEFLFDENGFNGIDPEQQFYINDAHQLVIVFDEYAVAPGYMGAQEFIIPSEEISGLLVSNSYIR